MKNTDRSALTSASRRTAVTTRSAGSPQAEHAEQRGVPYKKLRQWVQVATGKRLHARKGVPLA